MAMSGDVSPELQFGRNVLACLCGKSGRAEKDGGRLEASALVSLAAESLWPGPPLSLSLFYHLCFPAVARALVPRVAEF